MDKEQEGKGYTYSYPVEKLAKFAKLSAEEKLEWLEEILIFIRDFMPPKNKELYQKLRKGEI
jgi:hypothetical protein